MNARFNWNENDTSIVQTPSPRRHGDAAGRRRAASDELRWREHGEATRFPDSVRGRRAARESGETLSAWDIGAIRSLTSACEASVAAWQDLLNSVGEGEDDVLRDRCARAIRVLERAASELSAGGFQVMETASSHHSHTGEPLAKWRATEPRSRLELLGNVAIHLSALCERYASAIAGLQSEKLRAMLYVQSKQSECGLSEVRVLMMETSQTKTPAA